MLTSRRHGQYRSQLRKQRPERQLDIPVPAVVVSHGFFFCGIAVMDQTVTELKPQRRRKDRISVFLDGEYAFSLESLTAARLSVGQTLSRQEIAALKQADSVEWAKQISYRFLSYRPRSIAEVRLHLRGKDVDDAAIELVIERLVELELLDDRAFAQYWVEQRETFRPRSRRALQYELLQKGLDRETADQAVSVVNETSAALRAGEKKATSWSNLDENEFHLKMRGFLGRRGFDPDTISEAARALWQENAGNDV